jgi:hypothetical protein
VLGHDIDAAPDTHREVVELEARVGLVQIELDRQVVDLLDVLIHSLSAAESFRSGAWLSNISMVKTTSSAV